MTRGDEQPTSEFAIEEISSTSSHSTDSLSEESDDVRDEDKEWRENIKQVRRHLHF